MAKWFIAQRSYRRSRFCAHFSTGITDLFRHHGSLEDIGYMARAAFVMDRIMHLVGLHGKSFIPMFIGFGCNVRPFWAQELLKRKKRE